MRRAYASNEGLIGPQRIIESQPITRQGHGRESVRAGEVMDASVDCVLVRRSLARSPDQALIFVGSQNEFLGKAQLSRQSQGVGWPQWLVYLLGIVEIRRCQTLERRFHLALRCPPTLAAS